MHKKADQAFHAKPAQFSQYEYGWRIQADWYIDVRAQQKVSRYW
jgi:hypothetical protein